MVSYLHAEEGDGGEEVHGRLEVLEARRVAGRERGPVHRQVNPQRVVQLVQQLHKLLFLQAENQRRQPRSVLFHSGVQQSAHRTKFSSFLRA